jgi:hypothetical protein
VVMMGHRYEYMYVNQAETNGCHIVAI